MLVNVSKQRTVFAEFLTGFEQLQEMTEQRKSSDRRVQSLLEVKRKRRWNSEHKSQRKCRVLYSDPQKYPT